MIIDESLLMSYCDEECFKEGYNVYSCGLVGEIDVDIKQFNDKNINSFNINTFVGASNSNNNYRVAITFNEVSGFTSFSCECDDFIENYRRKGVCKHIIATMSKYIREESCLVDKNIRKAKVDNLINKIKDLMNEDVYKNQVDYSIRLVFDKSKLFEVSLEIGVGDDKHYLIKDIRSFLHAYAENGRYEVSKAFIFDGRIHDFDDRGKRLFSVLFEIVENEGVTRNSYNYIRCNYPQIEGRRIFLLNSQLKRILEIFQNESIQCIIDEREVFDVKVIKDPPPIAFTAEGIEEEAILSIDGEIPRFLTKNNECAFFHGNIYFGYNDENRLIKPIIDVIIQEGGLLFEGERRENLKKCILPIISASSFKLKVEGNLCEQLTLPKLRISFYLDRNRDGISCFPKFHYDDVEVDIFNPFEDQITYRNNSEEEIALKAIEKLGFSMGDREYYLQDEEKVIYFIRDGVKELSKLGEVHYTKAFRDTKIFTRNGYRGAVTINEKGMLKFSFDIDDISKEELWQIFVALRRKKKYFKLNNGSFINLEQKELELVNELLTYAQLGQENILDDKLEVPLFKSYYVNDILKELSFISKSEKFNETLDKLRAKDEKDNALSKDLEGLMRGYQVEGFRWMNKLDLLGCGGILADEMGLGKSLQAISFLEGKKKSGTSLIVCPSSLIYNWEQEFIKFTPHIKVKVLQGSGKEREKYIRDYKEYDVIITSYAQLRRDIEIYKGIEFSYCIVDEAQNIKNPLSMNAKAAKMIKCKGRFALTGTPIENHLGDLWSIFDFLMPGYLMNRKSFMVRYESPIMKGRDTGALAHLKRRVDPFILRRTKGSVVEQLPPKLEHSLIVDMEEKQKKVYMAYSRAAQREFDNFGFNSENRIKILAALTKLRQICSDPSTVVDNYKGESGKLQVLMNILEDCKENNKKVLVFSSFSSVLMNIRSVLEKNNFKYLYLDGNTKVSKRLDMVNSFNNEDYEVFLISLKAGGTGLNITGAEVVIHYDPWWNPAVEDQATDRAHRIGQTKTVEVIKLISKGTIEERVNKLQDKKKNMINRVIEESSGENSSINKITIDELIDIIR